jgi:dethiobiotin synthetase
LASRTTLGTINHTLLSLRALRAARIDIGGVIMVGRADRENRTAIEHYGNVQVVGTVPVLPKLYRTMLLEVFRRHFDPAVFGA